MATHGADFAATAEAWQAQRGERTPAGPSPTYRGIEGFSPPLEAGGRGAPGPLPAAGVVSPRRHECRAPGREGKVSV